MNSSIKFKTKKLQDLIPYVNNSRTHSDEQVAQIAASIQEFGFTNPVLIGEDNVLIAGHGRVLAARKLRLREVPCMVITGLSETQRRALVLADNRLALSAGWDPDMLALEIQALQDDGYDLALTGFGEDEIAKFLKTGTEGETDPDEVPEEPAEPISKLGDTWIMGGHRLRCGDSTSITDVEALLAGAKIDLVFTDPPYGINEKGDRSKRGGACQGNKLKDFIDDSIKYAIDAYNLCEGLKISRQVWWGANYYCHALPQSNNWFIWDKRVEEKQKDTQSDCEMAWVKSKWSSIRIFRHLWKGMCKGSEHGTKRVHPTQKPVALAEWAFDYFKEVTTVLDLFLGSGSTLIACEKTGRVCYAMEISPIYADVAVKRWENFTGKKAVLEGADVNKRTKLLAKKQTAPKRVAAGK